MSIMSPASPNDTSPAGLTPEHENDIRTRELLATRGPWGLYDSEDGFIDIAADLKENGTGYNCRRSITQLEADLIDNDPAHADWTEGEEREQVRADAEFIAHAREDVSALLAEVDQLRAQRDRRRVRLVELQNDALSMRGSLSPMGAVRKVPFELGETLTPAVDWLIGRVAELEAQLQAERVLAAQRTAGHVEFLTGELAARPSRYALFAELAHDVETATAELTGDAKAAVDMVVKVIRAKAQEPTVPSVEATS